MRDDETVIFKGKKGGITIVIDDAGSFESIKQTFRRKVISARKFFSDAKTVITFDGRRMTEKQEAELLKILAEESSLDISFVNERGDATAKAKIASDGNAKLQGLKSAEQLGREMKTYFYNGSLRSGQAIKYEGSVVIVGDVNPGAEVSAEGNIIILGSAKGIIHAGSLGDEDCYIMAMKLTPIQLRIADVITHIPKDAQKDKKSEIKPLYAFLSEGKIYINEMS